MDELLTALTGIASVAVLGVTKKYTGLADGRLAPVIKPIQPLLAAGLAVALPLVSNMLHLTAIPDAQVFAQAPTATLVGIVAREIAVRIAKR